MPETMIRVEYIGADRVQPPILVDNIYDESLARFKKVKVEWDFMENGQIVTFPIPKSFGQKLYQQKQADSLGRLKLVPAKAYRLYDKEKKFKESDLIKTITPSINVALETENKELTDRVLELEKDNHNLLTNAKNLAIEDLKIEASGEKESLRPKKPSQPKAAA